MPIRPSQAENDIYLGTNSASANRFDSLSMTYAKNARQLPLSLDLSVDGLVDGFLDLSGCQVLASLGSLDHLVSGRFWSRRCGEEVEGFQTQIRHRDGFVGGELMRLHIPKRGAIAPSELALQPRQPVAMATPCLRVGQPPADLDHVAHHPLA